MVRYLTLEQVGQLIANLPAGPFIEVARSLFLVAALTGLRMGELVALRWCDVDFAARCVRVRRNYTRGAFATPKSRRSARAVPLATEAATLEQLCVRSAWTADDDLVFAHPTTGEVLEVQHQPADAGRSQRGWSR
jgi:integrase